ncbi:hypothetical protein [Streptomyces sp. Agncl-13]|uniref:hypothetical protein n=1 Tax=Streptomyces sp. Agncl-13 TaxID=3400628 RepID=UPI003A87F61A
MQPGDRSESPHGERLESQAPRAGKLVIAVSTHPLDRAAAAQRAGDAGHARGKRVLTVDCARLPTVSPGGGATGCTDHPTHTG